ncbi:MAG: aminotransferase class V-fold PLP-dependent enzyme [Fluviicola sp.]|nr:aminotransferase class V-fold PLP-dependent enzyme [Fluviicola sp.]
MIDFRSDTVTKPSKEMKDAMFAAPVGDDVFSEDPSINELQQFAANMFGMEDAIYCSSGTQTNQIAINIHARPGGEVITHEESHIYKYEGGGIAKNTGASVRLIRGNRGRLTLQDVEKWINPDDIHLPVTQLVSLEDTSNRGGGAIYDFEEIKRISAFCRKNKMPIHLDGARLMNAMVENKIDLKEYASQFDSISLCLSKGLGAPVGSLLIGTKDFIKQSRRVRKVFGGGMRQAGIIAAGGLYALKNNIYRLAEDHQHAKALEATLNELTWVESVLEVETNIVVVNLKDASKRDAIISEFERNGIKIVAFGPAMLRFVTHLDISSADIDQTISILKKIKV